MKDYYQILQIPPDASQQEIKQAYRRMAKVYHPDVAKETSAAFSIQEINEAYSVLNHPQRRSRYDWLRANPVVFEQPEAPRPQRPPHSYKPGPGSSRMTERELVAPYVKYTILICKLALAFCFLLMLDFLLPMQRHSDELMYVSKVYKSWKGRRSVHEYSELHTISGRKVKVSKEVGEYFRKHPRLLMATTPIFSKIRYITTAQAGGEQFRIGNSIYGNFIFLPLLLLVMAFLGSLRSFPPEASFSFGIVSGTLLVICAYLVLV